MADKLERTYVIPLRKEFSKAPRYKRAKKAIKALKESGATVKGMVAIFSYGFSIASEAFEEFNLDFTTLSNYEELLEQALESNYINEKELITLESWRLNPSEWNQ